MENRTLEVRIPLGILAPTARLSPYKDAQRIRSDVATRLPRLRSQRIAVCDETALLAVANGRVIDLYHADAIHSPAASDHNQESAIPTRQAHLPSAGQIVVGDHLDGYVDNQAAVVHATCVAFVAPGFLLVAATATSGSSSASSSSSASVWLCGFRLYACTVALERRFAPPSSLLVHCSFVDRVPSAQPIASLDAVPSGTFTTREAGAVLVLFDDSNAPFGVFQWVERFSDRVFSTATLSSASLSVAAVSSDAQWVALADASGAVHVLDFSRFVWELSRGHNAGTAVPAVSGKRLALEAASRMGRIAQRDHPLASVRLVCQARTGASGVIGTSLRWWRPQLESSAKRAALYLLMGQSDGALAILVLKKEKDAYGDPSCALKTVEIYPAIRALKNDPVVIVSEPELCKDTKRFDFSTVTQTSWRQWHVAFAVNNETEKPRLKWPTLTDSLGLRTHQYDGQDAYDSLLLPPSSRIATRLEHAISHEEEATASWLFMLMRDGIRATCCFDQAIERKLFPGTSKSNEAASADSMNCLGSEEESRVPSPTFVEPAAPTKEREVPIETTTLEDPNTKNQHSALTTLQDRYKLPAMQASRATKEADTSSDVVNTSVSSLPRQRLTKDQYNSRLATMAQRVDRLNTNLHTLRTSFQLFKDDVQRHMTFICNQLEQLQDAPSESSRWVEHAP